MSSCSWAPDAHRAASLVQEAWGRLGGATAAGAVRGGSEHCVFINSQHHNPGLSPTQQNMLEEGGGTLGTDASGNPILKDIGAHLKTEIRKHEYFKVVCVCACVCVCQACSWG